jgi:hypothetical protein
MRKRTKEVYILKTEENRKEAISRQIFTPFLKGVINRKLITHAEANNRLVECGCCRLQPRRELIQ